MFRPIEYNNVSLYDWICLSHIEKRPKQKIQDLYNDDINEIEMPDIRDINNTDSVKKSHNTIFHPFLKGHPLSHSLHVTMLNDDQEYVPNFVGEAIQRSDRKDREFYHSTMLAFFKP